MEVYRGDRNCYNYGSFGYMTRYCRNRGIEDKIGEGRRLEYREDDNNEERRIIERENGQNNNLNRDEDLIVLN